VKKAPIKKMKLKKNDKIAWVYLFPSLVVISAFVIWPVFYSFVLSFYNWDFKNLTRPEFIGFQNYAKILFTFDPDRLPKYPFTSALISSFSYFLFALFFLRLIDVFKDIFHKKNDLISFILSIFSIVSFAAFSIFNTKIFLIYFPILVITNFYLQTHRKDKKFSPMGRFLLFVLIYFVISKLIPTQEAVFNYFNTVKDASVFYKGLYNTVYYVIFSVPITIMISVGLAILLNSNIKFKSFFRTAYFIPYVTSMVAVSLVWQWLLNDDYGLVNYFIQMVGLHPIRWLSDERYTIPAIIIVSVWKSVGYDTIIFLAGLQNIDKTYYEAAEIDGASSWQKFLHITWPLLSPTTYFIMIISLIGSFKVFVQIFILFNGTPGPYNNSGMTIVYYIFQQFYSYQKMGYASAGAYILFAIIMVFTIIQVWYSKKRVHYD
jgi:multiple sugar transport system permease protein